MIRAMMFDLDGVVLQSEKLKAQAYAMAVQSLRGLTEPDPRAIEAYRTIVGASREVAAQFVIDQLGLEPDLAPLMEKYGVSQPWQAERPDIFNLYQLMGEVEDATRAAVETRIRLFGSADRAA